MGEADIDQNIRAVLVGPRIRHGDCAVGISRDIIIGMRAGEHRLVLASASLEKVVAAPAGQRIGAVSAVELVAACSAPQDVVAPGPVEHVVMVAAVELVGAGRAVARQPGDVDGARIGCGHGRWRACPASCNRLVEYPPI